MVDPITEKQYNLLMKLLRSRHINIDKAVKFKDVHKLTKCEAYELIKALIEEIKNIRQQEYDYEVMEKHEGTPKCELLTSSEYNGHF